MAAPLVAVISQLARIIATAGPEVMNKVLQREAAATMRARMLKHLERERTRALQRRRREKYRKDHTMVGGGLKFTIEVKEGPGWARLMRMFNQPQRLLTVAAPTLVQAQISRHEQQVDGWGTRWPARKVPSIPGVIEDLSNSPLFIHPARFRERPVLEVTGNLKESYTAEITGGTIQIMNTAPYAALQHFGGLIIVKIPDDVKASIRRRPNPLLDGLRWILNRQAVEIEIPPRRLISITERDMEEVEAIVKMVLAREIKEGERNEIKGKKGTPGVVLTRVVRLGRW